MHKRIALFQLALGMPLRHSGRSAGTARGTVDGFVAVKHRISGVGFGMTRFSGPLKMAQAIDGRVFRMDKRAGLIDPLAQNGAESNYLAGTQIRHILKVGLGIHNRVEIAAIGHVYGQGSQTGTFNFDIPGVEKRRNIDDAHRCHAVAFHLIISFHQTGRRIQPQQSGGFGGYQPALDQNRNGANGSVTAHGQATAGFDEQDGHIAIGSRGRINDTARHHIVAPGLKHQTGANPVVLLEKMPAPLDHIGPFQKGAAAGYNPNGIAAGMGVDTEKSVGRHRGLRQRQ